MSAIDENAADEVAGIEFSPGLSHVLDALGGGVRLFCDPLLESVGAVFEAQFGVSRFHVQLGGEEAVQGIVTVAIIVAIVGQVIAAAAGVIMAIGNHG